YECSFDVNLFAQLLDDILLLHGRVGMSEQARLTRDALELWTAKQGFTDAHQLCLHICLNTDAVCDLAERRARIDEYASCRLEGVGPNEYDRPRKQTHNPSNTDCDPPIAPDSPNLIYDACNGRVH